MSDSQTSRMVKQSYTVRFTTPAFLGDAEQNGAWRTPPFKALLRQWWRVAVAKDYSYDHTQLREAEGRLFGNAWIEGDFRQSQIKLRLSRWEQGQLKQWPPNDPRITHPEVKNRNTGRLQPVGAQLYMGYGPLIYSQGGTALKANTAIQEGDSADLNLLFPKEATALEKLPQLIHWFGTVGGRSRNGWGSFILESNGLKGLDALNQSSAILKELAKPLNECLNKDWPNAFGKSSDERLLIWKSRNPKKTWRETIVELAEIKIAFRTQLPLVFSINKDADIPRIDYRHLLGYPVTHHGAEGWCDKDQRNGQLKTDRHGYLKQSTRLANQLRFKVTKTSQGYIGLAYHLPCGIPSELLNALTAADRTWIVEQQLGVWQSVHAVIDKQMQRIP